MDRLRGLTDLQAWIDHADVQMVKCRSHLQPLPGTPLVHWDTLLNAARSVILLSHGGFVSGAIGAARQGLESTFAFRAVIRQPAALAGLLAGGLCEMERVLRSIELGTELKSLRIREELEPPLSSTALLPKDLVPQLNLAELAQMRVGFGLRYRLLEAADRRGSLFSACMPDMMIVILGIGIDCLVECLQEAILATAEACGRTPGDGHVP